MCAAERQGRRRTAGRDCGRAASWQTPGTLRTQDAPPDDRGAAGRQMLRRMQGAPVGTVPARCAARRQGCRRPPDAPTAPGAPAPTVPTGARRTPGAPTPTVSARARHSPTGSVRSEEDSHSASRSCCTPGRPLVSLVSRVMPGNPDRGVAAPASLNERRSAHIPLRYNNRMRVLALDIGKKRTGVAVSDALGRIASPICVLSTDEVVSGAASWQRVLQDWEPEMLLAGLPLSLDGAEGGQARRVRRVGDAVAASCGLAIDYADERLSSAQAKRSLHDLGATEAQMRGKVDMIAASLFLQAWLDERNAAREEEGTHA